MSLFIVREALNISQICQSTQGCLGIWGCLVRMCSIYNVSVGKDKVTVMFSPMRISGWAMHISCLCLAEDAGAGRVLSTSSQIALS